MKNLKSTEEDESGSKCSLAPCAITMPKEGDNMHTVILAAGGGGGVTDPNQRARAEL